MTETKATLATIDYLHENPVRRGLVEKVTDWDWSSVKWYSGESDVHMEMDKTLPILEE